MPLRRNIQNNQQVNTSLSQKIRAIFAPSVTSHQVEENLQHLERHTAGGRFPHYGESRSAEEVNRPVQIHSFTSAPYRQVMGNIKSITSAQQQNQRRNAGYEATAFLKNRIPVVKIDLRTGILTGYTSRIGFFGDGGPNGFTHIRTSYPRSPSPSPPPSRSLGRRILDIFCCNCFD
ncbi:MAG: hypothetical protein LBO02_02710 [Holosporaceae bacterium]|jgi:hypothetical protein|nr:hypothetical protein [Holosporaceae bacterium]